MNACILVMIEDANDMKDELGGVEHGVESAVDMVFLSASGHDSTVLSVFNVRSPANLWMEMIWRTKWPGWNMEWSLLSTWCSFYCSERIQRSTPCQFVDEMMRYGGRNGQGGT